MTRVILADGAIDLRLGRWQDVLADVETCDAVITDVPYSDRVIAGQRSAGQPGGGQAPVSGGIRYAGWSEIEARTFVRYWFPRVRRWFVAFCSDDIAAWMRDELMYLGCPWGWSLPHLLSDEAGSYTVPWAKPDAAPSFLGTGPSPSAEWIVVARPRRQVCRRYRPGYYDSRQARGENFIGAKPLGLMRTVVKDYSEPGDLVVDPFCGGGTTALACAIEGRRCITSEMDPETFEKARKRLERGFTPSMFQASKVRAKQGSLV